MELHEQEPGQPSQYPDEQEDEPEEDEPEEDEPEEAAPEATVLRAPCSVLRANTLYPDYL